MSNKKRWYAVAFASVAAAAGFFLIPARHASPVAAAPRFTPAQMLDSNIAFYEGVAKRDPTGGMALGQLAIFYMRRARATG
ncbi:MAG TPA: hypothetical protein VIG47_15210, partial [Gemmatimonadaceae bacterium]